MGAADVALLALLVSTAKKQNDFVPILTKVYAVTLALMYAQFEPRRVFRRLILVSYAAMGSVSSAA
jgi:hypothetical protein